MNERTIWNSQSESQNPTTISIAQISTCNVWGALSADPRLLELIDPKSVALNVLEIHVPAIFALWHLLTDGRATKFFNSFLRLWFESEMEVTKVSSSLPASRAQNLPLRCSEPYGRLLLPLLASIHYPCTQQEPAGCHRPNLKMKSISTSCQGVHLVSWNWIKQIETLERTYPLEKRIWTWRSYLAYVFQWQAGIPKTERAQSRISRIWFSLLLIYV